MEKGLADMGERWGFLKRWVTLSETGLGLERVPWAVWIWGEEGGSVVIGGCVGGGAASVEVGCSGKGRLDVQSDLSNVVTRLKDPLL
jgi:hypothetical protein